MLGGGLGWGWFISLEINLILRHLGPVDDPQVAAVIEGQADRAPLDLDPPQEAAVAVEALHAPDVADVDAALPVDADRHRRAKLARLVPLRAETIDEPTVRGEAEDGVVELPQRQQISLAIGGDAQAQLGIPRLAADRLRHRQHPIPLAIENNQIVLEEVPSGDQAAVGL